MCPSDAADRRPAGAGVGRLAQKCAANNQSLLQMAEQKQADDALLATQQRRLDTLQKLCTALESRAGQSQTGYRGDLTPCRGSVPPWRAGQVIHRRDTEAAGHPAEALYRPGEPGRSVTDGIQRRLDTLQKLCTALESRAGQSQTDTEATGHPAEALVPPCRAGQVSHRRDTEATEATGHPAEALYRPGEPGRSVTDGIQRRLDTLQRLCTALESRAGHSQTGYRGGWTSCRGSVPPWRAGQVSHRRDTEAAGHPAEALYHPGEPGRSVTDGIQRRLDILQRFCTAL